jgi:hypothetical protein
VIVANGRLTGWHRHHGRCASPTISANIVAKAIAGTRTKTLNRRPSAMPTKTLIIANANAIAPRAQD